MWKSGEKLLAAKEYMCIDHITATEIQDVISTMRTFTQLSLNHRLCSLFGYLTNSEMHFMESAVLLYNLHQLFSTWQGERNHFFSCDSTEETKPCALSPPSQPPQKHATVAVCRELGCHTCKCLHLCYILVPNFPVCPSAGFNRACN